MIKDTPSGGEAAERSTVYALLSRAFLEEPDVALIRYFRSDGVQEVLASLDLSLGADFVTQPEAQLQETLARDYARLFLTPPIHIPPYQSFFVGGLHEPEETFEPRLQGKASQEVAAFYREHGLVFPEESTAFPDHVGIELEALRWLSELEASAASRGEAAQALQCRQIAGTFLREQVLRWVPTFCEAVVRKSPSPFYVVLAQLTRSFIESELEELTPCGVKQEEVRP
jgi:TorA maturation chaperone TorD